VARWSDIDLNNHVTPGNWCPNNNARLMLDFIHADVNKRAANAATPNGVSINAIAMRTRVAF